MVKKYTRQYNYLDKSKYITGLIFHKNQQYQVLNGKIKQNQQQKLITKIRTKGKGVPPPVSLYYSVFYFPRQPIFFFSPDRQPI